MRCSSNAAIATCKVALGSIVTTFLPYKPLRDPAFYLLSRRHEPSQLGGSPFFWRSSIRFTNIVEGPSSGTAARPALKAARASSQCSARYAVKCRNDFLAHTAANTHVVRGSANCIRATMPRAHRPFLMPKQCLSVGRRGCAILINAGRSTGTD
jgi:hypothetical protein